MSVDEQAVADDPKASQSNAAQVKLVGRRRIRKYLAFAAGMFFLFVCSRYYPLYKYKQFIVKHYSQEIATLEAAAMEWTEEIDREQRLFFENGEFEQGPKLNQLKSRFVANDFHFVYWSIDGHHGARSLKNSPVGDDRTTIFWETWPVIPSPLLYSDSLRNAQTNGGTKLLVYTKWVRNAPFRKQFQIYLRKDQVNQHMADSAED